LWLIGLPQRFYASGAFLFCKRIKTPCGGFYSIEVISEISIPLITLMSIVLSLF